MWRGEKQAATKGKPHNWSATRMAKTRFRHAPIWTSGYPRLVNLKDEETEMKTTPAIWLCGVALVGALSAASRSPAQPPTPGKGEAALRQAAADNRTVFLLFYRDGEAQMRTMAQTVQSQADKNAARATWATVSTTDPSERAIVDKFQLSRAPMPMVLAVHPNGAVTGHFTRQVSEANLAQCLVSPKKAECMKGLQQNQMVLLCVQTAPDQAVAQGVREFQADPQFAKRTQIVTAQRNDPNETAFMAELKIAPQTAPVTVFMAPPGVMVGTFPATTSKEKLAAALTAAGKCCEDPNCKHHHK